MDFWENQYRNKGVFEFNWQNILEMEERAKGRPRSIYEGGEGWLALRKDTQRIDPPRMSVWFPNDKLGGLRKCERCTEIGGAESKFFEQLNIPQKAAATANQVASSSKSVAGGTELEEKGIASSGPTAGSQNAADENYVNTKGNDKEVQGEVKGGEQSMNEPEQNPESDARRGLEGWKKTENEVFIEFKEAEETDRANYHLCKCKCSTDGNAGNYGKCEQCVGEEEETVKGKGKGKQQVEEAGNSGELSKEEGNSGSGKV